MPYADTDFFIALLKEGDWLASSAKKLYVIHKNNIYTSLATILELLLLSKKFNMPPEKLMSSVLEITKVPGYEPATILHAAHLMEEEGVGVFDSFHAAACGGEIISSDHVYDRLGIVRIKI